MSGLFAYGNSICGNSAIDAVAPVIGANGDDVAAFIAFIAVLGFVVMLGCRALGLIPAAALPPIGTTATLLTVVSMAALGLGVDIRTVARAGGRVTSAVILSLVGLGAMSFALIMLMHLA